jgi:hypothetical protein
MPDEPQTSTFSWRDGISQSGRIARELDPDYAPVDERTTRDLLAFARAYAGELNYFGADDPTTPSGDWRGFFGAGVDLDDAASYARAPETFPAEKAAPYARPHFALFLAFLELLALARKELNGYTRRHLEFLYRDILQMVRKRAVPDQVHVLVDLEAGTRELLLPAGTALRAGKDSEGRDLLYRTDVALTANRVQVGQVSSLYADASVIGIREANRQYLSSGTRDEAFLAMMKIALGQPDPGDPLPPRDYPVALRASGPGQPPEITFDALVQAHELVRLAEIQLGMPLLDDLRELVRLKATRQANDSNDWRAINALLEKAGKTRTGNPAYQLNPQQPADFQANLLAALGLSAAAYARLYDGLPEVKSIEQAYAAASPQRPDVLAFITTRLYLSLDDFASMMQTRLRMDDDWARIDALLEKAGRRIQNNPAFTVPQKVPRVFDDKLAAAAPNFNYPGGLDAYYQAFVSLERYFYMSAEAFRYIMSLARREDVSGRDDEEWDRAYDIVTAAHEQMFTTRRRNALEAIAQRGVASGGPAKALEDMLNTVTGKPQPLDESLKSLETLGVSAPERQYIEAIAAQTQTTPDWKRVAVVLEMAQRQREGIGQAVAEKVEWRNLYPAPDATAVKAASARASDGAQPWKPFGRRDDARAQDPPPAASYGCALASPLLAMREGARTIELTLGFSDVPEAFDVEKIRTLLAPTDKAPLAATFNPFEVQLSTAKGWWQAGAVAITWKSPMMDGYPVPAGAPAAKLRALIVTVTLSESDPAITPPTRAVHGLDLAAPVLRLMLRQLWSDAAEGYVTSYQLLRDLVLLRARLAVSVTGLAALSIANDQSTLDARKPFEPFGAQPATGSRFYFGHPEIVAVRLDRLGFRIEWMAVPPKLDNHYKNYLVTIDNTSFKARVGLADGGVFRPFSAALPLFDGTDATRPVAISLAPPSAQGSPADADASAPDVTDWSRYFVWELGTPDFQHSAYPAIALQKTLKLATDIAAGQKPAADAYQVNPPYTPKIKKLGIDYAATAELAFDAAPLAATPLSAFHIEPFGYTQIDVQAVSPGPRLLPQYDFRGELYIGLANVTAPQNVSLLFELAEGSADPDVVPEPVQWSYLSDDRWLTLHDGSVLADATLGLTRSGIVELSLKPAQPGTILPAGFYWIRLAIPRAAGCVCDIVVIHPNAVLATFADPDNAPDHLAEPLPPGRITAPAAPMPGVARVRQPYSSFGGKPPERDAGFYVRVSERLRHKQRALTTWDYERLVLEKFPQIYKVKCLRADPNLHPHQPGRVELVVIPDIRNRLPFDPFEPKAPVDAIREIEAFLRAQTPPFVSVAVKNALYVALKVRCGVRFMPGEDVGFSRRRLNDELNRFLSPWAYDEGADLVIGGSVYANSIIDFIDGRDYVDYIAGFKLFKSEDGAENFALIPEPDTGSYSARPDAADSVLVAARQHEFDVILEPDAQYSVADFRGIDYMRVGLDFIVASTS